MHNGQRRPSCGPALLISALCSKYKTLTEPGSRLLTRKSFWFPGYLPQNWVYRKAYSLHLPQHCVFTEESTDTLSSWTWVLGYEFWSLCLWSKYPIQWAFSRALSDCLNGLPSATEHKGDKFYWKWQDLGQWWPFRETFYWENLQKINCKRLNTT